MALFAIIIGATMFKARAVYFRRFIHIHLLFRLRHAADVRCDGWRGRRYCASTRNYRHRRAGHFIIAALPDLLALIYASLLIIDYRCLRTLFHHRRVRCRNTI